MTLESFVLIIFNKQQFIIAASVKIKVGITMQYNTMLKHKTTYWKLVCLDRNAHSITSKYLLYTLVACASTLTI